MKRILAAFSGLILLGAYLTACGGGSSSSTTPQPSGLTKRVFVTNSEAGTVLIIDASQDVANSHFLTINGMPRLMALAQDASVTLVSNGISTPDVVLSVIDNKTETNIAGIQLPGRTESFVALNNATGFASVRNANVVEVLDLTNAKFSGSITVPTPNQIVLSHSGKKLLVFSDSLPGSITVVDTSAATTTPGTAATTVSSANFDHPISGVFSSDDGKAYILSCGAECGGTAANVTVVDMTTTPPTPGTKVPVAAATAGLLNGTSLYVAGNSSSAPGTGELTVVDVGALTAGGPVAIGDGFHSKMGLDNHGHLFIGAETCSQLRCLTIYDTSTQTATIEVNPDPNANGNGFGDVAGIQPISGRDRLYLAQGGEIRIFDTTTAQPLPTAQQLDVVGFVGDVLLVDP